MSPLQNLRESSGIVKNRSRCPVKGQCQCGVWVGVSSIELSSGRKLKISQPGLPVTKIDGGRAVALRAIVSTCTPRSLGKDRSTSFLGTLSYLWLTFTDASSTKHQATGCQ